MKAVNLQRILWCVTAALGVAFLAPDFSPVRLCVSAAVLVAMILLCREKKYIPFSAHNLGVIGTAICLLYLLPPLCVSPSKLSARVTQLPAVFADRYLQDTRIFLIVFLVGIIAFFILWLLKKVYHFWPTTLTLVQYGLAWFLPCWLLRIDPLLRTGAVPWTFPIWSICLFHTFSEQQRNKSKHPTFQGTTIFGIATVGMLLLSLLQEKGLPNTPNTMVLGTSRIFLCVFLGLFVLLVLLVEEAHWKTHFEQALEVRNSYVLIAIVCFLWLLLLSTRQRTEGVAVPILVIPLAQVLFDQWVADKLGDLLESRLFAGTVWWSVIFLTLWIEGKAILIHNFYLPFFLVSLLVIFVFHRLSAPNRLGLFAAFGDGVVALLWYCTTLSGFRYSFLDWDMRSYFLILTAAWLLLCAVGSEMCKPMPGAKANEYALLRVLYRMLPLMVFGVSAVRLLAWKL